MAHFTENYVFCLTKFFTGTQFHDKRMQHEKEPRAIKIHEQKQHANTPGKQDGGTVVRSPIQIRGFEITTKPVNT